MANTNESSKALPIAGRATATTTATQLTPSVDFGHQVRELLLQAHPDNSDNVEVGNKDSQEAFVLQPGESFSIPLGDPGQVWIKSASGSQFIGYLGRD